MENKNVKVLFEEQFNGNYNNADSKGFRIVWNDKPLDKWDTYNYRTKAYKRKSKWQGCWDEILKSFNEETTPNDISKIVSKYGSYYGFYSS